MENQENFSKALTPNTIEVFDEVSKLDCIKELYLCGGTSIALQLNHRKSEDLDFELIAISKTRPNFNFADIINEINSKFPNTKKEILGNDHFLLYIGNNVKLSFYRPENPVPYIRKEGFKYNNIKTPTLQELLGMKLYVITKRCVYRDYYDIYALLKSGCNLAEGIDYACRFSRYQIHSKSILNSLLFVEQIQKDSIFDTLDPIYKLENKEMKTFFENNILEYKKEKDKKKRKGLRL